MMFYILSLLALSLSSAAANNKTCTVIPLGHGQDDVPNILKAIHQCVRGGRVILPSPYTYGINQRMKTHLENSRLELEGTLLFSDNINYWVNNSYRVDFQNQSTAWHITGNDYEVDGGRHMGGIDGNGQLCSKESCTDLTFEGVNVTLPEGYTGSQVLCENAQVKGLDCNQ